MDRVPDWVIERYLVGELVGPRLRELEQRLTADPELAARVDALKSDGERILAAMPPRVFAAGVETLARADVGARRSERSWSLAWLALPAVALAGALVLALPQAGDGIGDPDAEVIRLKGDAHLVLHRQTATGAVALADGDPAHAGELIQVSVQPGSFAFGAVLSLDGRGAVTVHHPRGGSRAAELPVGEAHPLGQAYELDDAPGFERFFLVVSERPFEVAVARRALEELARDAASARTAAPVLPAHLTVRSVLLVKE